MKVKIFVFPVMIGVILIFLFISVYFLQTTYPGSKRLDLDALTHVLPKAVLENLDKIFDLEKPWYKRYLDFLGHAVLYDLGSSYRYPHFTVNQLVAMRLPMSALYAGVSGAMLLVSLFLRAKKPRNLLITLLLTALLIFLSLVNMYFMNDDTVKAVIATLVFIGCLSFLAFRGNGWILNYSSTVLVILCLFQWLQLENLLNLKGLSFYSASAVANRDYTLVWGVQYSLFLLATLTGVLVSYGGVYLSHKR